jgi:hypothetical protein
MSLHKAHKKKEKFQQTGNGKLLQYVSWQKRFGSRGKKDLNVKEPEVEAILTRIVDSGLATQLREHQVVLWRIKVKENKNKLKLEMDTSNQKDFDIQQFANSLADLLQMKIEIEQCSIKKCCHGGCGSCLNYPKRCEWVG